MNRNNLFRKALVFIIITLFFCVSFTPCINAIIDNNQNDKKYSKQTNDINVNPLDSVTYDDVASLTFFTFDKSGRKQNKIDLPSDFAMEIKNVFEELEYKIVYEPKSIETQELKNSFISLVDEYGLISDKQSKDDVFSLLNPVWLKSDGDNNNLRVRDPFSNVFTRPFLGAYFGFSVFCSVSSAGSGLVMPLFMLPRPRAVGFWFSYDYSVTSVANLFTGRGFLSGGVQSGLLLGFMGVGLSYSVPGATLYGFIGYSLFVGVTAELMEFYPPNNVPVISGESPENGAVDVPVSLSELSFKIEDDDGDLMDYHVRTDPDIGSGQDHSKKNGVYSVPVSGLESDKKYSWAVEVSDGKASVEKTFSFITVGRPPFDPFTEGWMYRKKITINHTQVTGNLVNFPVLVSAIDSDLVVHAQFDGDDILFMDGVGVANKLYHEIENYDGSSGELVAWVRVPSLSGSQDIEFYMYYGNPSCSSQQFPEKAWNSNYKSVHHFEETEVGVGAIKDSTQYNVDFTTANIETSDFIIGKIGNAVDLDGSNEHMGLTMNSAEDYAVYSKCTTSCTNPWTISAWIKIDKSSQESAIAGRFDDFYWNDYGTGFKYVNGNLVLMSEYDNNNPTISTIFSDTSDWHYVVGITHSSNGKIYLDGVLKETGDLDAGYTYRFIIGAQNYDGGLNHCFDGKIDEFRTSDIERDQGWISTEYNNQIDPSTFLSFGPEETPS
jgi:hypothetical protein